jgi:hypothetical protein
MAMAVGNMGGIVKSRLLKSGVINPTSKPEGHPHTKPHRRTGRCMGKSILPIWGIWPVKLGRIRPSARNKPERTRFLTVSFIEYLQLKIPQNTLPEGSNTFVVSWQNKN